MKIVSSQSEFIACLPNARKYTRCRCRSISISSHLLTQHADAVCFSLSSFSIKTCLTKQLFGVSVCVCVFGLRVIHAFSSLFLNFPSLSFMLYAISLLSLSRTSINIGTSILCICRRTGTSSVKPTNATKFTSKKAKRSSSSSSGKRRKRRQNETRPTLKWYVTPRSCSKVSEARETVDDDDTRSSERVIFQATLRISSKCGERWTRRTPLRPNDADHERLRHLVTTNDVCRQLKK